jgi:hypothetical protein
VRLVWTAFLLMGCEGFLIYDIGFITPYLGQQLGVAPWVAALPSSATACGLIVASWVTHRLRELLGARAAIRAWAAAMAVAGVLLAFPVSIVPVIAAAFLLGLAIGGTLFDVNSGLGTGARGGMLLSRANLASMCGGLVAPLAMSAAAHTVGWSLGVLLPIPLLLILVGLLPGSPANDHAQPAAGPGGRTLNRGYWLCWAFVALSVAGEFSFVAWGSQVVRARTGIGAAEAIGLASLFAAGMVIGRSLLAVSPLLTRRPLSTVRLGAALVVAGALCLTVAPNPFVAGLGLLLGGFGTAPAYPLGASLSLAHAPGSPVAASARLTSASGLPILLAPLGVGVVATAAGFEVAWLLVIGLLITTFTVAYLIEPVDGCGGEPGR